MATGSGDSTLFGTAPPWAQPRPTAAEINTLRQAAAGQIRTEAAPEKKVDNTAQVMKDFADLQVLQEAIDDVIRNPRLSRSKPLSETLQHLTGYLHIQKIKLEAKIPKKSSDAQCEGGS